MLLHWFLQVVCRRGQWLVEVAGFFRQGIVWECVALLGGGIEWSIVHRGLAWSCRWGAWIWSLSVIVASSWSFYIILPTLMMHGQTQIKISSIVSFRSYSSSLHLLGHLPSPFLFLSIFTSIVCFRRQCLCEVLGYTLLNNTVLNFYRWWFKLCPCKCACENESTWISVMLTQCHITKTTCMCVYCISCHDAFFFVIRAWDALQP